MKVSKISVIRSFIIQHFPIRCLLKYAAIFVRFARSLAKGALYILENEFTVLLKEKCSLYSYFQGFLRIIKSVNHLFRSRDKKKCSLRN